MSYIGCENVLYNINEPGFCVLIPFLLEKLKIWLKIDNLLVGTDNSMTFTVL